MDTRVTAGGRLRPLAIIGIVILLAGGSVAIPPLRTISVGMSVPRILSGEVTAALGDRIAQAHPWRTRALAAVTAVRLALFGQGSGAVVVGRDGWLFSEEEIAHHPGDEQRTVERVEWVIARARAMAMRGTTTLVVLLPSKARIHAAALPPRIRPLAAHPRLDRAAGLLRQAGIATIDARAPIAPIDEPFLRRDTHWRGPTVDAVAREVANHAAAREALAGLDLSSPRVVWRTIRVEGDLLQFVPLGSLAPHFGMVAERAWVADVAPIPPSGGLFDDPWIPVVLVGTSYSGDERWNFAGLLRARTGHDVLNVAESGAGPFRPLADYLASDAGRDRPPQLVVWEIPERYLTLPDFDPP